MEVKPAARARPPAARVPAARAQPRQCRRDAGSTMRPGASLAALTRPRRSGPARLQRSGPGSAGASLAEVSTQGAPFFLVFFLLSCMCVICESIALCCDY
jgi:hypothetical protein